MRTGATIAGRWFTEIKNLLTMLQYNIREARGRRPARRDGAPAMLSCFRGPPPRVSAAAFRPPAGQSRHWKESEMGNVD